MRKYLPFTIAKSFKNKYVIHAVADFETCLTESRDNVRVWAWGFLDYLNGEYKQGTNINSFLDAILTDKNVYDIGFQHHSAVIVQRIVKAVAGRVDARLPVQRIHCNTGIICQCRQTGSLHNGLCLDEGVFLKGSTIFFHIDIHTQIGLEYQLHVKFLSDLTDFL